MMDQKKYTTKSLLEIMAVLSLFALLSACHHLPIHYGHSVGHSSYGHYQHGSHRSIISRTHSRDY